MAEPSHLDPSAFDSLPQIDPSNPAFFDPAFFPDDLPVPPGLSEDFDFDGVDIDLDLEFPIEDLFQTPAEGGEFLPYSDEQPAALQSTEASGVSSSASPVSGNPSSTLYANIGPPSPESGHSASYAPDSGDISASSGVSVKRVEEPDGLGLKRKKEDGGANPNSNHNPNPNPRGLKLRRSEEANSSCVLNEGCEEEEEKKKSRLMRNRESAQLSRQRKKHYVEELEDKVKAMQATIVELNNKISYIMAENVGLRHQLGGGGNNCPPPGAVFPPPAVPMAPVHFPWIPGYPYRPQGSHVPLVPIPRMKPQQPAPAPKVKKSESKTKKVASVSLLGLLFVVLLFGGLVPGLNLRYGGGKDFVDSRLLSHRQGRILPVSGRANNLNRTDEIGLSRGKVGHREAGIDRISGTRCRPQPSPVTDVPVFTQNSSESLPALLYVPRNGKHVKINGNLIIHSVLASERAMGEKTSRDKAKQSSGKETGLAIAGNMAPVLAVSQSGKEMERHSKSYRSSAGDTFGDALKSFPADGPLQQWFREGLAGPILSSGMCTEVFRFDVSRPSADPNGIVPAASIVNATDGPHSKSARSGKTGNRRILYPHPIPLPGSALNDTEHDGKPSGSSSSFNNGNASVAPMVVSVLLDPREAGDGDSDGMMSPKSLSRIFVVVLLDSVKYVTYSCVLPFKGSGLI